jgi:hypothetical protein
VIGGAPQPSFAARSAGKVLTANSGGHLRAVLAPGFGAGKEGLKRGLKWVFFRIIPFAKQASFICKADFALHAGGLAPPR